MEFSQQNSRHLGANSFCFTTYDLLGKRRATEEAAAFDFLHFRSPLGHLDKNRKRGFAKLAENEILQ